MKSKLSVLALLAIIFLNVDTISSQKIWNKVQKINYTVQKKEIYQKKNFPSEYEILSLDLNSFSTKFKKSAFNQEEIIYLPNFDGSLSRFKIKETSNFEAGLQAKFPSIKSYSAQGIDNPTAVAKISVGTDGFHAIIFSGNESTVYIDPYSRDNKDYIVYKRSSLSKTEVDFKCEVEAADKEEFSVSNFSKNANDGKLRTFRLALVCSGEYAQFHLGAAQQNIPVTATDIVKKEAVLSAMNTSLTRLNGIFEKDLSIKLVLVDDNDKVVFLDAATDGITDGNANTMIDEVQSICDDVNNIGNANYDIGHIFSTGGSGLAGLGVACVTGQKASGVTGIDSPVGDPYDIDYVVHEMGHQFGATHTQNNDCNRTDSTAVEPGSASTIMGYAGICSPDVQSGNSNGNSDDYFHAVSIAQMWATIQSSASCGTLTETTNTAPVADAGLDYSIPKSTPFVLKGTATDVDGLSSLTYNWEQLDIEIGTMPPVATSAGGPMFRSLPSRVSPNRYMPDLTTVIGGNTSSTWEVVPSVARELNFSFLVRDNYSGGGSTSRDDVKVDVVDAEAFTVSSPSTAVSWDVGSTQTITWTKGTSDVAPISCLNVNIKLSIDGGLTFPITIKENTPNDGTEDILIPNNVSTTSRIMVEAADNIFYNVNSINFIINSTVPTFIMNSNSATQSVCNSDDEIASYILNFDFVNGFSEDVSFTPTGQPAGSVVTFSPTTINEDGDITMQISGLNGVTPQGYTINVAGNANTVNQNIDVQLNVTTPVFEVLTLISPVDGATDISLSEDLTWDADSNAVSYDVQVATDSEFSNLIASENVTTASFSVPGLNQVTTYFWRVKAKNSCGEGDFSSVFSFTTISCTVCASSGNTSYETSTTFVKFNTIENTSTKQDVGGAIQAYFDYTSISTDVKLNESHDLTVHVNTAGNYRVQTKVWIDWNQNCSFDDDGEEYDLGFAANAVDGSTDLSPLTITVPAGANLGKTVMRVSSKYTSPTTIVYPTSCEASFDGEVEDYTINVAGNSTVPTFIMNSNSATQSVCNSDDEIASYILNFDFVNGFSEDVSFTPTGQPAGSVVTFSPTTINEDGDITMQISGLNGVTPQGYTINVAGNANTVNQNIDVQLNVTTPVFEVLTLISPVDGATDISLSEDLTWDADSNAVSYDVQVATDSEFSNLIASENVTTASFSVPGLNEVTTYFWRIKAKNSCGEGDFSSVFSFTTISCTVCEASGNTSYETSTTFVKFNTIENTSTKQDVGGVIQAYFDYTSISTDVKLNESHDLTVHVNTAGNYRVQTKVWIDWNQNCSFDDDGEEYDLGFAGNAEDGPTDLCPLTITVPAGANLGNTVMRVSSKYTSPTTIVYPTSCEASFDGEVEDYTINVQDVTVSLEDFSFAGFNLYPNPTKGEFTLNLEVINTAKVSVQLYDIRGRLIDEKDYYNTIRNFSERILFKKASAGLYLLKVTNGQKQTTRKLIIK
jgi:hypothetical protein